MRRDQSPHVAVLVDTSTSWGRRLIRGIVRYSEHHGPWHLSVEARGQDNLRLPIGWKGHGVIARIGSSRMLRELEEMKLPVVNVSAIDLPRNSFPQIITDYRKSAQLAVQHFCDRGFRRFAYSGLPRTGFGRRHRDAFKEAVEALGFTCEVYEPLRPRTGLQHQRKRQDHTITWLQSLTKPVGIFTWATDPGRDLLEACRVAGISVPYEVAVLGGNFDELLCDTAWPPMSGILVPSEQIGNEASKLLDRLMHGSKPPTKAILIPPTGVIEKRSTDTLAIDDADVAQALAIIRGRAFHSMQVSDILKAVPVSRRSIERKFNQVLGRTPTEEIRRVRMAKAKSLLAETSMPMQAVADACGFGTYNYLSRVFTQENGITPRDFRKKVQGR
jgi:LacI family transcriptional regulator